MKISIEIPDLSQDDFQQIESQFKRSGWKRAEDVFSDAIRQCLNVGAPFDNAEMRARWEYRDVMTPRPEITVTIGT